MSAQKKGLRMRYLYTCIVASLSTALFVLQSLTVTVALYYGQQSLQNALWINLAMTLALVALFAPYWRKFPNHFLEAIAVVAYMASICTIAALVYLTSGEAFRWELGASILGGLLMTIQIYQRLQHEGVLEHPFSYVLLAASPGIGFCVGVSAMVRQRW